MASARLLLLPLCRPSPPHQQVVLPVGGTSKEVGTTSSREKYIRRPKNLSRTSFHSQSFVVLLTEGRKKIGPEDFDYR